MGIHAKMLGGPCPGCLGGQQEVKLNKFGLIIGWARFLESIQRSKWTMLHGAIEQDTLRSIDAVSPSLCLSRPWHQRAHGWVNAAGDAADFPGAGGMGMGMGMGMGWVHGHVGQRVSWPALEVGLVWSGVVRCVVERTPGGARGCEVSRSRQVDKSRLHTAFFSRQPGLQHVLVGISTRASRSLPVVR
jgi:hypothetical protein